MRFLYKSILICLVTILGLNSTILFAQEKDEKVEIIYLEDGSVIRGKIIEKTPDDYVMMQLTNGEKVSFFWEEIIKIKYNKRRRKEYFEKPKGFYNETTLGVSVGRVTDMSVTQGYLVAQTIGGYKFNPYLRVGLGVARDEHPFLTTIPVFLNVGGDIGNTKVVPSYFFNTGYGFIDKLNDEDGFNNPEDAEGGWFINPGMGLKVKVAKVALLFQISYRVQKAELIRNNIDFWGRPRFTTNTDRTYNRIAFTTGISF
ncbi:hypothetical protein QQ008_05855 [Fulvivirgaceae bacterium BMA10]|uniref:Outer membrane protein beta-barrel domain-containing protein n=1 Tax=Splendidivirga corallicola TaxID=3051826 RepID=A0ABT8KJI9_9BACT|nr:hypothetical protein [Fulvivirgaceae bacterium BMA10]